MEWQWVNVMRHTVRMFGCICSLVTKTRGQWIWEMGRGAGEVLIEYDHTIDIFLGVKQTSPSQLPSHSKSTSLGPGHSISLSLTHLCAQAHTHTGVLKQSDLLACWSIVRSELYPSKLIFYDTAFTCPDLCSEIPTCFGNHALIIWCDSISQK